MPATLETISHDALELPPSHRVALAYQLLLSIESKVSNSVVSEVNEAEIEARIARYDAGLVRTIPAAQVFASLRQIAPDA